MAIYEVDPITRIEGHLGVKLDTGGGSTVVSANVHGNLWRGFENFLIGRDPNDAITFTQRICGVCPLPHATASMFAVESVLGYSEGGVTFADSGDGVGVPAKAVHIRNIVYAAEFLMSAVTHFYHLAAPSYIQGPNVPPWTPFFADGYYHPLLTNTSGFGTGNLTGAGDPDTTTLPANAADGFSKDLWSAVIKQYVHALRIRRLALEAGALFAGRMPMVSAFVAGGTTNDTNDGKLGARCTAFRSLIQEVGTFIVKEYVPTALALGALYPNYDNLANANVLNDNFPALWELATGTSAAPTAGNTGYGKGYGNFLSWGAFPDPTTNNLAIKGGYKYAASAPVITFEGKSTTPTTCASAFVAAVKANLTENIARSHYSDHNTEFGADDAAYPGDVSRTKPNRVAPVGFTGKYSWLKAPRWNGNPMEVGPLARLVINGLYPSSGTLLANGIGGLYGLYAKGGGLNPALIGTDLAVTLVRAGLATVTVGANVYTTAADAIANIGDPAAEITGVINAWVRNVTGGLSIMDRHRARALEALFLATKLIGAPSVVAGALTWPGSGGWIGDLAGATGGTFNFKATPTTTVSGFGVSEAPRGALAHFITISAGTISKYQCVVPTTWNASPKDQAGNNGPMEQAMLGIPFKTRAEGFGSDYGTGTEGGVEALRVAQSFDPCIACAVH